MSVEIEPLELTFRRPFTVEVAQILRIKNPSTSPLAFKVKTTAPKQYCVRPNAGRVEPGQDFDVTVLLQAMKADPPLDAKCRDKFLVQSAPITPDKEFASIATVLESTDKTTIQERKIRVNWLPADEGLDEGLDEGASPARPVSATPSRQSVTNLSNDTPEASRSYSSPGIAESSGPAPPPYVSDDTKDDDDAKSDAPKSVGSRASTAVSNTAHTVAEELRNKIAQLEAELANYRDGGLRQRNVKTGTTESDKAPAAAVVQHVRQPTAEGVPVQIVALLCLVSFLLAYLFF